MVDPNMGETAVYDYQCLDDMAVRMRKEMTNYIYIYICLDL